MADISSPIEDRPMTDDNNVVFFPRRRPTAPRLSQLPTGCSVLSIIDEADHEGLTHADFLATARSLIDRAHETNDVLGLSIALGYVIKVMTERGAS